MQLSVIILNYKVPYFLTLCLKSVQAAIVNLDAEIIVIDNNSEDESCQLVSDLFPEVILLKNTKNVGFSKANNQAVKSAKGEYVCILNPDTVVAEDTFTTLLKFISTKSNVGIVGCKLIDGAGKYLPESKRNIPTPEIAIKKIFGFSKNYYVNDVQENEIGKAAVFVGAFMLIKRSVYEQVGGFDEDYFMYGEDIDLSYKIQQAGFGNYYNGQVTVIHYKGESTLKNAQYASRFYGAMQLFYQKHFRKNILFDALVFLGIKILPLLPTSPKKIAIKETIVLDNHKTSFKKIIQTIATQQNYYTIIPNGCKFSIGSNSSNSRGEVEHYV